MVKTLKVIIIFFFVICYQRKGKFTALIDDEQKKTVGKMQMKKECCVG